jgi:hypothetical protein
MNQVEFDGRRQRLVQGFHDALLQTVEASSEVSINGPISTSFGEIKLGGFVCSYTDNPYVNVLDIWFGRLGGRAGHPGEIRLEADVVNEVWRSLSDKNEQFTNAQLTQWCLGRLREVEAG